MLKNSYLINVFFKRIESTNSNANMKEMYLINAFCIDFQLSDGHEKLCKPTTKDYIHLQQQKQVGPLLTLYGYHVILFF